MSQKIAPRKITNSFYYIKDSVKPMPCVDIIVEPRRAKNVGEKATPRDVSGFLERMKKKYKVN